jgi:glucokinase
MILAGDVGGTNTRLGLFRQEARGMVPVVEERYPSQEFKSLEAIVREFVSAHRGRIGGCAVGVAGPVADGRSQVVNLRWSVDRRRLARALGLGADRVHVLNDLEATAWGLVWLPPRKLRTLTPGLRAGSGNAALIAAGTGLGMALLIRERDGFRPYPSEGGHQQFGPRDELEIELLRFLMRRLGRVSVERLVSGPAISAIYRFLLERRRQREPDWLGRRLAAGEDPNALITEVGLAGEDAVARETLELFVSLYGAAAGDLALVAKATGGVYVGGGIAPRMLPLLESGGFVRAFRDKGRLTPLVETIPIKVIVEPRTALIGAAARAAAERQRSARR